METVGSFDADSEFKLWVSGGGLPFSKECQQGIKVVRIQKHLVSCFCGGALKKG